MFGLSPMPPKVEKEEPITVKPIRMIIIGTAQAITLLCITFNSSLLYSVSAACGIYLILKKVS